MALQPKWLSIEAHHPESKPKATCTPPAEAEGPVLDGTTQKGTLHNVHHQDKVEAEAEVEYVHDMQNRKITPT